MRPVIVHYIRNFNIMCEEYLHQISRSRTSGISVDIKEYYYETSD